MRFWNWTTGKTMSTFTKMGKAAEQAGVGEIPFGKCVKYKD